MDSSRLIIEIRSFCYSILIKISAMENHIPEWFFLTEIPLLTILNIQRHRFHGTDIWKMLRKANLSSLKSVVHIHYSGFTSWNSFIVQYEQSKLMKYRYIRVKIIRTLNIRFPIFHFYSQVFHTETCQCVHAKFCSMNLNDFNFSSSRCSPLGGFTTGQKLRLT